MIGYLPRKENTAVSQMLDRGMSLHGCISSLNRSSDPWERVAVEVFLNRKIIQLAPGVLAGDLNVNDQYFGGFLT